MTPAKLRNKAAIWHMFAEKTLSPTDKEIYSSAAKTFEEAANEIENLLIRITEYREND